MEVTVRLLALVGFVTVLFLIEKGISIWYEQFDRPIDAVKRVIGHLCRGVVAVGSMVLGISVVCWKKNFIGLILGVIVTMVPVVLMMNCLKRKDIIGKIFMEW